MNMMVFCLVVILLMIVVLVIDRFPVSVPVFSASLIFGISGLIEFEDVFSGFASNTIMLLAGTMVIGECLFCTGAANLLGTRIIRIVGYNEKKLLIAVLVLAGSMSAFVSNSACVAMFIPLVRSVCAGSGGKMKSKHIVMPLGLASIVGGGCTLIGSTPQLVAQSIFDDRGLRLFSFFELAQVGVPVLIVTLLYFMLLGHRRICAVTAEMPDLIPMHDETNPLPQKFTFHMGISIGAFVFVIVGFITGLWVEGAVALVGAAICIITGCIEANNAYRSINWSSLIVITGALGIGTALTNSGATELIAVKLKDMLGDEPNMFILISSLVLVCSLFGNLFSHTSCVAILAPIFISYAQSVHIDPTFLVFCVIAGINSGLMTPLVTGSYTMTLSEGYRFVDYFKVGWPLNVLSSLTVTVALILSYYLQYQ